MESLRRASEVHKIRTGKRLKVSVEAILNEEMYEEEDAPPTNAINSTMTYDLLAASTVRANIPQVPGQSLPLTSQWNPVLQSQFNALDIYPQAQATSSAQQGIYMGTQTPNPPSRRRFAPFYLPNSPIPLRNTNTPSPAGGPMRSHFYVQTTQPSEKHSYAKTLNQQQNPSIYIPMTPVGESKNSARTKGSSIRLHVNPFPSSLASMISPSVKSTGSSPDRDVKSNMKPERTTPEAVNNEKLSPLNQGRVETLGGDVPDTSFNLGTFVPSVPSSIPTFSPALPLHLQQYNPADLPDLNFPDITSFPSLPTEFSDGQFDFLGMLGQESYPGLLESEIPLEPLFCVPQASTAGPQSQGKNRTNFDMGSDGFEFGVENEFLQQFSSAEVFGGL
jgi:hypothetical protein